jgi:pimeloyl-ACP methyl ester carboxylesterase
MTKAMPVLAHRDFGEAGKPPVVVLHGLLGSSRNWQTAGRGLAASLHVCALDLRNHGASFRAPEMDYGTLAGDVVAWLDAAGWARAHVVGHSMGGKVAMRLACEHPARVDRLVVVDIAPKACWPARDPAVEAVVGLEVETLGSRQEAEERLAASVPDAALRRFLLTNLERTPEGRYRWSIDVGAIAAALPVLRGDSLREGGVSEAETLFVVGGRSRSFAPEDEAPARKRFPRARIVRFAESGHNPHIDAGEAFVREVASFLGGP